MNDEQKFQQKYFSSSDAYHTRKKNNYSLSAFLDHFRHKYSNNTIEVNINIENRRKNQVNFNFHSTFQSVEVM